MRWRSCIACFNSCCCQVSNITTIIFILFITTTRLESRQLAGWCLPFFSSFPSSHSGSMMSLSWGNKWWFNIDNITVTTVKMPMVDAFNTLCLLMKITKRSLFPQHWRPLWVSICAFGCWWDTATLLNYWITFWQKIVSSSSITTTTFRWPRWQNKQNEIRSLTD